VTKQILLNGRKSLKGRYTVVHHIECICPRCSKIHFKALYYTGKFPARFFCSDCKDIINEFQNEEVQFSKGGYTGSGSF